MGPHFLGLLLPIGLQQISDDSPLVRADLFCDSPPDGPDVSLASIVRSYASAMRVPIACGPSTYARLGEELACGVGGRLIPRSQVESFVEELLADAGFVLVIEQNGIQRILGPLPFTEEEERKFLTRAPFVPIDELVERTDHPARLATTVFRISDSEAHGRAQRLTDALRHVRMGRVSQIRSSVILTGRVREIASWIDWIEDADTGGLPLPVPFARTSEEIAAGAKDLVLWLGGTDVPCGEGSKCRAWHVAVRPEDGSDCWAVGPPVEPRTTIRLNPGRLIGQLEELEEIRGLVCSDETWTDLESRQVRILPPPHFETEEIALCLPTLLRLLGHECTWMGPPALQILEVGPLLLPALHRRFKPSGLVHVERPEDLLPLLSPIPGWAMVELPLSNIDPGDVDRRLRPIENALPYLQCLHTSQRASLFVLGRVDHLLPICRILETIDAQAEER